MTRPRGKFCIDCGTRPESRQRDVMRCGACYRAHISANAKGRSLPDCLKCGRKLSTKANKSGLCSNCYENPTGFKRPHGKPAWNKGLSAYAGMGEDERRAIKNRLRREHRALRQTAEDHLADRIRTLIRNSLRRAGHRKNTKTATLLGCSPAEFKSHIEKQLLPGMSWDNYGNGHGRWNIDHIIPLASFDLSKPENQLAAFHFTNCRPLWAIENVIKGCKLPSIDGPRTTFGRTH